MSAQRRAGFLADPSKWAPALALAAGLMAAGGARATDLDRCVTRLAASLPREAGDALRRIEGRERRLLALRGYLRSGDSLRERWSWPAERIALHVASPEYREIREQLAAVTAAFERANPGHSLYVNDEVRSLDLQIRRWNENPSVTGAARSLERAVKRSSSLQGCSGAPPGELPLAGFLMKWRPPRPVTLAVPGLSRHGQGIAFDFQIMRDGRIIADTNASMSVRRWDEPGWTARLRAAIDAAGARFTGPLESPHEPWHYEYFVAPASRQAAAR